NSHSGASAGETFDAGAAPAGAAGGLIVGAGEGGGAARGVSASNSSRLTGSTPAADGAGGAVPSEGFFSAGSSSSGSRGMPMAPPDTPFSGDRVGFDGTAKAGS